MEPVGKKARWPPEEAASGNAAARKAVAFEGHGGRYVPLWPFVSILWTVAAEVMVFADARLSIRPLVVLAFVLFFPGNAFVRLLRIGDPFTNVTLSFAVSLATTGLVSVALLYAGAWSPPLVIVILAAATLAANLLEIARGVERRRRNGSAPPIPLRGDRRSSPPEAEARDETAKRPSG